MSANPKFRHGIRVVAGCYLIYLAYQVIRDGIVKGGLQGRELVIGVAGSVAFIIIGVLLAVTSSRKLVNIQKAERLLKETEAAEATAAAKEAAEEGGLMKSQTSASEGGGRISEMARLSLIGEDEETEEQEGSAEDAEDAADDSTAESAEDAADI